MCLLRFHTTLLVGVIAAHKLAHVKPHSQQNVDIHAQSTMCVQDMARPE